MTNYDAYGFEEKPKKPFWKKTWVWVLVVIVLFLGVRQFRGGTNGAAGDGVHEFEFDGATYEGVKSGEFAYVIIDATTAETVGAGVHSKKASGIYLLIDMGAYNYRATSRSLTDRTFHVRDEEGKVYRDSTVAKTALFLNGTPYLYDFSIAPSETVRGFLAFDIPKDKIDQKLEFIYINEKEKEIKIEIKIND
jgi:hypothetical protein